MAKYGAFLRGVNLGKRNVKKEDLIKVFSSLDMHRVQTVLASGNVIFESSTRPAAITIENGLADKFGFQIGVVLRSLAELDQMISSNPFSNYEGQENIKFYVTLTAGPVGNRLDGVRNVKGDFDLVRVDKNEFYCAAYRQESGRFGAGLDALEKNFKDLLITSRNWNTIGRIVKKAMP